ncbi:P-loop containing nucleoside triphosphate hydrolase protein [Hypoxylon trugodes]|uniref:P-loop containing nucleoside triphosphate hydrolase protein n=1 Tax=Hypoxylon trugodes TaxID=326681 RepID=UPI00219FB386|nr:P-loop containing nucleoside triphosphate hydrolase protein [Hypoxylon trugodes]KAI1384824.1 P-loop containing nucleoside triphosphate hydrolase protein [Hypoxylon trugodes]
MEVLRQILEYILTPSAEIFIVGAIIVLILPTLVHLYIVRTTPYTTLPSILLLGPSGGGKTALLTLLERGDNAAATHTSQDPQSIELTVSDDHGASTFREAARDDAPGSHRKFLLVDTPGHGKLRTQHANTGLAASTLRGVVYVVDASALDDSLPDAAGYLYDILLALQKRTGAGKTSKTPNAIHVLVAANKLDLFTALPASLVKSNLEAELGRIRQSRSKGLLDSGVGVDEIGSEEQDDWLGAYGSEKFLFDQMREFDIEVEVIGGSVLEGKVDKWWDWISGRI